jgi:putative OPT family oligopeptide transporter
MTSTVSQHPPDRDLPSPTLRGELTWQSIAAGVVVAAIMGAAYPYMVLKLGFGPNVSVVSAFFGFLFLKLLDIGGGTHYNRWQNNLVEAAGTSAAQTAFMCTLLAAFDLLHHNTHGALAMTLSPAASFLWLTTACTLGVLLAVPLRRHFVVDENLPYPDGIAAAETVLVLDPPRDAPDEVKRNAMRAFKAVMGGMFASGVIMVFRADAKLFPFIPEGWDAPWVLAGGVVLANMAVGASYSLLSVGSGMIIGFRVTVSMVIGGVIAWVIAPYFLVVHAVPIHHTDAGLVATATPSRTDTLFWVMWPATGMLVTSGLAGLALRWRMLVETFRSLRNARLSANEMSLRVVIGGAIACAIALCAVQAILLGMPVWITATAIVLSVPLMLVGLRVLGETNWGPISQLSNMMQGVFAALAPHNVLANMVASGTTGTVATSSESIMQDYRAGAIVGSRPRNLTVMQLIAVPIGAAAVSWMYPVLTRAFPLFDSTDPATGALIKAQLTSPLSNKWAGFAQLLQDGVRALPTSALYALIVCSLLGILMTVIEHNPKVKNYMPSPTALGVGMLVPLSVVSTMFVGGLVAWLWVRRDKRSADIYMLPLASGLIAGEAMVAVFAAIYLGTRG